MPNFVHDNTSLPAGKSNKRPVPAGESSKHLSADEFGTVTDAIKDLGTAVRGVVSVLDQPYSADPTGAAAADTAIASAIAAARVLGHDVRLPPGRYKASKRILAENLRGMKILGSAFTTIVYSSDDTTITPDATDNLAASPDQAARSGFYLRNCTDVTISGIQFQGGTKQQITSTNIGAAIYAARCRNLRVDIPYMQDGYSPFAQEANDDTTGTGDSLTVSGGVVTLADAAGTFVPGHNGCEIVISGSTDVRNDCRSRLTYVSPTQVSFPNPAGQNETSSFSWRIINGDSGTVLSGGSFVNCRGPIQPCPNMTMIGFKIIRPGLDDVTGIPRKFSISGSTVTMTVPRRRVTKDLIGKLIIPTGATSAGNNVGGSNPQAFVITNVTPRTSSAPATIEYTNANGVSELAPAAARFIIPNGEKVGIGNGTGAITKSGDVITFVANENAFSADDVGKMMRLYRATSVANVGGFVISEFVSATTVKFKNANGVAETFAGVWAIDSFDSGKLDGNTYGSTHGVYMFSGRSNISIVGVGFYNVRTISIKMSGSGSPLEGLSVIGCTAEHCGSFVVAGADDSQEHSNIVIDGCRVLNCGNGRAGWSDNIAIWMLGVRNVKIGDTQIHYSREATATLDGRGAVGGYYGIFAGRYVHGVSQPVENLEIDNVSVTRDKAACQSDYTIQTGIHIDSCGLLARHRTGGTLTKSGNLMTLSDSSAAFSQELAEGWTISLVNSASGNDVEDKVIESVSGTTALTFTNAGGTGGGVSAGTYRIQPPKGDRVSMCRLSNLTISAGGTGVNLQYNVAPQVVDLTIDGCAIPIAFTGDSMPHWDRVRLLAATTANPGIRINSYTSWPIAGRDMIAGYGDQTGVTKAVRGDVGIGVDAVSVGGSTRLDYPLLGTRVRAAASQGRAENVFAFGSRLVDGDTIGINGNLFTYKESSPSGNQFNGFKTGDVNEYGNTVTRGLLNLIDVTLRAALGLGSLGLDAGDYGDASIGSVNARVMSPNCPTKHILFRLINVGTTVDNCYIDTIKTCYPTALVVPRNDTAGGEAIQYSRGEADAGPVHNKTVFWTPCARYSGAVQVAAQNAAAATLLQAGGYYHGTAAAAKAEKNSGCCEVITHNSATATGTQQFRAWVH